MHYKVHIIAMYNATIYNITYVYQGSVSVIIEMLMETINEQI